MPQSRLRVGIAGYGVVGKRRRVFIDKHPLLKTTAVCDQNFAEPEVMADGVRCFSNYLQLLASTLILIVLS